MLNYYNNKTMLIVIAWILKVQKQRLAQHWTNKRNLINNPNKLTKKQRNSANQQVITVAVI